MGIRASDSVHFVESTTFTPFEPQYNRINEKDLDDYIQQHPFPNDPVYSVADLKNDLLFSEGLYILPKGVSQEMIKYIEDLLNHFIF